MRYVMVSGDGESVGSLDGSAIVAVPDDVDDDDLLEFVRNARLRHEHVVTWLVS